MTDAVSGFADVPPEWVFYLSRPSGPNVGVLGAARTRRLSFALDGAAAVSFTMPGDHPETALIEELSTDVICGRNGVALFRGRVGASSETLSANVITSTFSAVDYRGMLARRILWSGVRRSFRAADQADIAWAMIADSQTLPGGDLGVTRGQAAATGVLRDRDYDAGKNLGEALDQLGRVIDGFEWDIDALRRFNLYYPRRGRQTGLVLSYGRDITDLRHSINPAEYANAVRFNGSEATQAVELAVENFPPERGRWDAQRSDVNLVLQSTVDERGRFELETAAELVPAFSVAVTPGRWDPGELWVGDTARLVVGAGRLDVDVTRRIVGIDIDLDDDGGETVRLSVGAAEATLTGRVGGYDSRIKDLERTGGLGYIPDVPVGAVLEWAGQTAPRLFMWCDGTWLLQAEYPDLFAVLGNTYGGDGPGGTFALPDCRGRMTLAAGAGPGLTNRNRGEVGGAELVALAAEQNGNHGHRLIAATTSGNTAQHSHGVSIDTGYENTGHAHTLGNQLGFRGTGASGATELVLMQPGAIGTGDVSNPHIHRVEGQSGGDGVSSHTHVLDATSDDGAPANQNVPHQNMPPWIAIGKIIRVATAQNPARTRS